MGPKILSQSDIDFVNDLIVKAGKYARDLQASIFSGNNNEVIQPNADQQLSDLLVSGLRSRFLQDIIISEEDLPEQIGITDERTWLIDPIDGTQHYLENNSQYSVMLGFLSKGQPIFGWVYIPSSSILYYGGPGFGIRQLSSRKHDSQLVEVQPLTSGDYLRVLLGRRDKKHNPWLEHISNTKFIQVGGIGFKLGQVLENQADMLIHLAGHLKVWDTAGPIALALAAGLDVGNEDLDRLPYPESSYTHNSAVLIGKKGSLSWFRSQVLKVRPNDSHR